MPGNYVEKFGGVAKGGGMGKEPKGGNKEGIEILWRRS